MKAIVAIVLVIIVSGCSKPDLSLYAENDPEFDFFTYFGGQTTGWGIVQNRSGELIRQFVVSIDGAINDDGALVMNEAFSWSDGEESTRVWTITREDTGSYAGTAGDVVGAAVGNAAGNVFNWRYYLNIDVNGSTWKVHLDDWMYLHRDQMLVNKSQMSKFGIHLGDITIAFSKQTQGDHR